MLKASKSEGGLDIKEAINTKVALSGNLGQNLMQVRIKVEHKYYQTMDKTSMNTPLNHLNNKKQINNVFLYGTLQHKNMKNGNWLLEMVVPNDLLK